MASGFKRFLDDGLVVTLTLAIAGGSALYQTALGAAYLVDGFLGHDRGRNFTGLGGNLTWTVGHRVLTVDQLLMGIVELGVVVAVGAYLKHRSERHTGRSPEVE